MSLAQDIVNTLENHPDADKGSTRVHYVLMKARAALAAEAHAPTLPPGVTLASVTVGEQWQVRAEGDALSVNHRLLPGHVEMQVNATGHVVVMVYDNDGNLLNVTEITQ